MSLRTSHFAPRPFRQLTLRRLQHELRGVKALEGRAYGPDQEKFLAEHLNGNQENIGVKTQKTTADKNGGGTRTHLALLKFLGLTYRHTNQAGAGGCG
jgi:hypothetical protein